MTFRDIYQLLITLLFISFSTVSIAKNVSHEVRPGVVANAEYEPGEAGKPAVIVLHGFLQSNDYLTLSNIKDTVLDTGFSLLAPIISLDVNKRSASLPCQATHQHTMQDSLTEIDSWMRWLKDKGHTQVILIGHSFGSVQAVAYAESRRVVKSLPVITKIIGVSLIDSEYVPDIKRRERDRKIARQRLQQNDTGIYTYRLSYCNLYRAPAGSFLSYADWNSERIIAALQKLSKRNRIISILGSKDKRVPVDWPDKQKKAGAVVKIIQGANHFFGGNQQIDLIELLDEILGE